MKAEKQDRRSLRTRQLLSDALVSLLFQQRYDTITVQDIIDRANVGRSTFYKHFYDKDDLLVSNIESLLERLSATISLGDASHSTLLPSRRLFEHVGDYRALYQALVRSLTHDLLYTYVHVLGFSLALGELVQTCVRSVAYGSTFIVFSNGAAATVSRTVL
jgi:AcrR family transcriptional regulator